MTTERTGLEIAIIGMAGRFPGANNTQDFWQNLVNGVESISFFSKEELLEEGLNPDLLNSQNYVPAKGILAETEFFDYSLFNYSVGEAEAMDPQLRILHEVAWEALEDGVVNPETYQGSIGVYTGASPNLVWMTRFANRISLDSVAEQYQVGIINDRDFFSTRLAYKLNLRGPAYTIQSACSTSLVAIHLACQGLLGGDCDIALSGGTSILLPKKHGYLYQEGMILSPDGHCKAFDAHANGTVGGDGVALVLLKRLEDAIADRDHIYAIIKGTACNNDGARKVGYAAPSIAGQAEVIKAAHRMAEVKPESVSYVETHGTGTAVGDPIELEGLTLAFDSVTNKNCRIGSVKTNIGHLDATAGVAGLIKTALALEHKVIPASLNYETPNPRIDFDNNPFLVNTESVEWKRVGNEPLRAGVNSYGIGGTNAHAVLEEPEAQSPSSQSRKCQMITLSAKSKNALESACAKLANYLEANPDANLSDVAYTLHIGRRALPIRKMLLCSKVKEAVQKLRELDSREVQTAVVKDDNRPVTFMFSGQGSQYVNMGRELYEEESIFRQEVDQCFAILRNYTDENFQEILYPQHNSETRINETEITQPLIFVFEYALAKLMMHWGITPNSLIGHSIGEYVAATLSGVFDLQDALRLVTLRGKLMQQTNRGSMLSVSLLEAEVKELLPNTLSLAAVNSPTLCVVSGLDAEIQEFAQKLTELGHNSRKLHTSHAFHSAMMEPILDQFAAEFAVLKLHTPSIPFISNVSGTWITNKEATDPMYWVKHLRSTVRFADGLQVILQEENAVLLEIGPGKALATFAKQHPERKREQLILNLIRHPQEETSDSQYLIDKLGQLWLNGMQIEWEHYYAGEMRNRLSLPTYTFDRHYFSINVPDLGNMNQFSGRAETGVIGLKETRPQIERTELPDDFIAPRTELETKVADIFAEVLGIDKISVHEDFFDLGGDSLKALVVISKLKQKLSTEVTIADFFKNPDIERLAHYVEQISVSESESAKIAIQPAEEMEYYPLSTAQKREFIVEQLAEGSVVNNISQVVLIEGEIDLDQFEHAIKQVIEMHESLRTGFVVHELEPVQKIFSEVEFTLAYLENASNENDLHEIIGQFIRPFELSQPPLFRVGLAKLADAKHLFIIDMHHIIGDGTSTGIFVEDVLRCYHGQVLPPMRLQYKDYAVWQQEMLNSPELQKQKEYWLSRFANKSTRLNLPLDFARPKVKSHAGDISSITLSPEESAAFKRIGQEEGATLYMNLLAVYNLLLAKYTGQNEIVVGTAIAGRNHADLQRMIGMFINLLVICNQIDEEMNYCAYLENIKSNVLEAFANQDFPFDQLVAELNVKRDSSRSPFFDVALNVQNFKQAEVSQQDLRFKQIEHRNKTAQYDLTLNAWDLEDGLRLDLIYSTDLFKPETIQKMMTHLYEIIQQVTINKAVKLKEINLSHALIDAKADSDETEIDFEF